MLYAGNTAVADILPIFLYAALRDFLEIRSEYPGISSLLRVQFYSSKSVICMTIGTSSRLINFRQLKAFAKTARVSSCLLHSISWGKLVTPGKGPQFFFGENGLQV